MAAPPSKPSPSNKEVQQPSTQAATDARLKDPPPGSSSSSSSSLKEPPPLPNPALKDPPPAAVVPADTTTTTTTVAAAAAATQEKDEVNSTDSEEFPGFKIEHLSYERTEASEYFLVAKAYLNDGDFEQALSTIEVAIEETKAILMSFGVENVDLHESIAPFHYLYGTTLLYSIEESNDTQVTVDTAAAAAAAQLPPTVASAATPAQDESGGGEQTPSLPSSDNADDMHIAWENLEVARTILGELLTKDTLEEKSKSKLQLDLAQILLREGDLQRLNGRYTEAVHDYEACLQLRKLFLPEFDRKIADAQYNLGLSYLSNSSELQKNDSSDPAVQKQSQEHCRKGVELYVAAARTLCGLMAFECGVEPSTVLEISSTDKSTTAGLKTTGLEITSDASESLSTWRKNVASLPQHDLKELLDEIQEIVDEAERSQEAVRQASQLKIQAQKSIEKEDEGDGPTTTIGFDKPTLTAEPTQAPMMVVKKKKKRDLDTKPPADDTKRAKTE